MNPEKKEFRRKFDFSSDDGTKITISLQGQELITHDHKLAGPHGNTLRLDYVGPKLTAEQQETVNKLLLSNDISELNTRERELIADAKLTLRTTATAGRNGPIVRFDCTWVTWDD